MNKEIRKPTLLESSLAILQMAFIVTIGFIGFKIRIEILMILSAVIAGIMAIRLGFTYHDLEKGICEKMMKATPSILLIWTIGMVIASFMFSGSVPMVIRFGLELVKPKYIYVCSFFVCSVLSLATGTSWGSAATGGVAMMGVAAGMGVPLHINAAAIICGSILGDKLSPLSDTTNLAPLCCDISIYDHIKSMLWTTLPSSLISLIVFWILGMNINVTHVGMSDTAIGMISSLDRIYDWNFLLLIPFIVLLLGALLKFPPILVMIVSSIVALAVGTFVQDFNVISGLEACVNGFKIETFYNRDVYDLILTLLNRGGIKSMVGIVVIVYCGYAYAAIVEKAGFLEKVTEPLLAKCHSRVSLVAASLIVNFLIAACSGSSYAAFIITGETFSKEYDKHNIGRCVLSRSMEDSGTMMMPLVPWTTASVFYAATLGVSAYGAGGYALYSINTYLNPIMAILIAFLGIGMYQTKKFSK